MISVNVKGDFCWKLKKDAEQNRRSGVVVLEYLILNF